MTEKSYKEFSSKTDGAATRMFLTVEPKLRRMAEGYVTCERCGTGRAECLRGTPWMMVCKSCGNSRAPWTRSTTATTASRPTSTNAEIIRQRRLIDQAERGQFIGTPTPTPAASPRYNPDPLNFRTPKRRY